MEEAKYDFMPPTSSETQLTRDPRTDFEEGGRPTPRDQIVINEILTLKAVVARYRASA